MRGRVRTEGEKEDREMKVSWNRMMGFRGGREVSCSPFVLLGEKNRGAYEDKEMIERMGTLAVWVGWKLVGAENGHKARQSRAGQGKKTDNTGKLRM